MAWPLAIFVVTRAQRFRDTGPRVPAAEDNGFEGLAVLMAILGFVGLLCSIIVVIIGFSARDEDSTLANILLTCGVALVVRSIIHVSVGARAVLGTAVDAVADFVRYANVGMAIGAGVGILLSLYLFIASKIDFFAATIGLGVLLALLAWPAIVRRFVQFRQTPRRAPDAGITALGWLLLGGAALTLGSYLATMLWEDTIGRHTQRLMLQMLGMPFTRTPQWWALLLGAGQLWAALEVLGVTPRRRIAASLWGVAAAIYTTIEMAPDLKKLLDMPMEARAIGFAAFLLAITPPVATLLLVNRRSVD
jgi:hypothetical protein